MRCGFEEILEEKRQLVWQEIEKYLLQPLSFSDNRRLPACYRREIDFHWRLVADYPRRKGKYLRPTLLLLTAEAMGVPYKKALKTAAAMQVSEDWILAHDDFEDDSLERRGKPTLHRLYGAALSVNGADALHIMMWKILRDNEKLLGPRKTLEIMDEFYEMLSRTALGQTIEIKWTRENKTNLSDKDCFFIFDGKTSYYTIAGPMRLGALIGGAGEKELGAIYEFAQPLGRCFQITDDLLDLTSDFRGLKKQQGNDIYEGKRTIMLAHLFRVSHGEERKKLREIMGKERKDKTAKEVEWVKNQMEKKGSLAYARKLAGELAREALSIFEKKLGFLSREPARAHLRSAVGFILKRDY